MQIRERYIKQLDNLQKELVTMSIYVEEALLKALNALETNDTELAESVIKKDEQIDEMHTDIEERCIRLIASEQPVAHDLRTVAMIIKTVSHVERIGDHARHLAKIVGKVSPSILKETLPIITKMAKIGIHMLKSSIDTCIDEGDTDLLEIIEQDKEIDELHRQLYIQIIDTMKHNPESIEDGVQLLFINRFMERLGDHVRKICDWVCFSKTGKRIEE